ncbi:MAG: hypothetical protein M3R17_09545 [Bacteroidota bacterium]|nr:hypothetical protein [Bacteroidota bacterium]
MLKTFHIDTAIKKTVNKVSEETLIKLEKKYGRIDGREEDITSKLEDKLGDTLVDGIQREFSGTKINGLAFDLFTYKKKQEKNNGADVLGVVDITLNGQRVKKAYLAQCKIGKVEGIDNFKHTIFSCISSKNILEQAEKMLAITSDSFFFIYTKKGIYAIPAFQIRLCNKKHLISSKETHFLNLGTFYSDFFKCFIGDEKLGNSIDLAEDTKFDVKMRSARTLIYITIKEDSLITQKTKTKVRV